MVIPESRAQSADPIPPPLSAPRAKFYRENPEAWSEFLSHLPSRPEVSAEPTPELAPPPSGGSWQAVPAAPTGVCNPLLLTDGTVMVHGCQTPFWYKLTPDITGSYVKGTWLQLASLPTINGVQYEPLYHASAVLPDGRVIIMGGEYNGSSTQVETNSGAIYDPLADTWTAVAAPTSTGWTEIGDAQSVVLANGTFMLGACCSSPDVDALLNAKNLHWAKTGAPNAGDNFQPEQGYELLPNGNVLTIDIWTDYPSGNATNAEQYNPSTGTWSSAGNTPVGLADPFQCHNWEIGPAVLRPDGTLVAFGGNSGCSSAPSTVDPTAIYDSNNGTWAAGPNVPALCGSGQTTINCTLADAPAALLPNGNILFAAGGGYAQAPTHFFEFASGNTIAQVADTLFNAATSASYYYNFLVLPNGQIFSTDLSTTPEVYTPTGTATAGWAPVISTTDAPSSLVAGATYAISGTQFNGLSQGAYYGDDVQGSTNYPIVQITNSVTGHVFYGRTFNHSTMSVAPSGAGSTTFTVPQNAETGPNKLAVIANGIASQPMSVGVQHSAYAKPPDFDKDGNSDILWRNADGDVQIWFMSGGTVKSKADLGFVDTVNSIVATGDFDGDGHTDILWRNAATGDVFIWLMSSSTVLQEVDLGVVPMAWTIVGTGDFDHNGASDILWRNAGGQTEIWFMSGGSRLSIGNLGVVPTAWTIVGIGDFDADGHSDILWRNASGQVEVWFMNGAKRTSVASLGTVAAAWTVAGVGDFDGDTYSDILWRNASGQAEIWFVTSGPHISVNSLGIVPVAWTIVGTSDFDGDHDSDILWRNASGQVEIWLMKAHTRTSAPSLGIFPNTMMLIQ